ncbi:MAG TPA: peptide MFS transporter [Gemmatimonadales bacterium]|nr:peptide MFS transporter [Gemmatimonadales bacterium]
MATVTSPASDTAFFGHPKGLSTLFFTEMWERFSFYGLRAILVIFMSASVASGGLGFDVGRVGLVYGMYVSLVYMMSLPGGWVADRILGLRRSVFYGGILIMLGQLSLAVPGAKLFYLGLAFIIFGTGLLKPNVSAIVGELYGKEDLRRDAGFSIFYMGINLGAFIAPLIVGGLAQSPWFKGVLEGMGISPTTSWNWGFGVGALGMLFGIIQYRLGWKNFGDAGIHPSVTPDSAEGIAARRHLVGGILGLGALVAALAMLVRNGTIGAEAITTGFSWLYLALVLAFFAWLFMGNTWTSDERKRLIVIVVLFAGATVFWSAFEQAASTLNLFALDNTRNSVFGLSFPSTWFQSVNALLIIIFAPVFGWIWLKLGKHDPSSPAKFAFGLVCVGLGFVVMVGAANASASGALVSPWWLVATYFLHTIGELSLSPVGLSSMTKLAPAPVKGMMMGVWFMAASIGNLIAGGVLRFYTSFTLPQVFGAVAAFAIVAGLIMATLVRPIRRMMARTD